MHDCVRLPDGPAWWLQLYERTCPVKNGVCQPAGSIVNTGTLNVQGANTTTVLTDPTAPIYFLIGNAGTCLCQQPLAACKALSVHCQVLIVTGLHAAALICPCGATLAAWAV